MIHTRSQISFVRTSVSKLLKHTFKHSITCTVFFIVIGSWSLMRLSCVDCQAAWEMEFSCPMCRPLGCIWPMMLQWEDHKLHTILNAQSWTLKVSIQIIKNSETTTVYRVPFFFFEIRKNIRKNGDGIMTPYWLHKAKRKIFKPKSQSGYNKSNHNHKWEDSHENVE